MTWVILSTYFLLLILLILLIREKIAHKEAKAQLKWGKIFEERLQERIAELEVEFNKLLESTGKK